LHHPCVSEEIENNVKARPEHREGALQESDGKQDMKKVKAKTYSSVWDAIAESPQEAANLRLRAELMGKITAIIAKKGWTQLEAAGHCAITQPRINDLLRGRISRFSLDALVNIASALGRRVHVELKAA
jgi:predicted XRE-type DNA-binding protein